MRNVFYYGILNKLTAYIGCSDFWLTLYTQYCHLRWKIPYPKTHSV